MMKFFEAVATAWAANGSLVSAVPGSIWIEEAKTRDVFPYVVIGSVSERPSKFTNNSTTQKLSFQVSVFTKEDGANDPVAAAGALLDSIKGFFDGFSTEIPGPRYKLSLRYRSRTLMRVKSSQGVWRGTLDYDLLSGG